MASLDEDDLAFLEATYARKDAVPSLDELFIPATVGPYHDVFAPGTAVYFFTAPFRVRITSGWVYLYSTVVASETDYVTLSLASRRISDGDYRTIVAGHVTLSGPNSWGTDLTYGRAYSFNAFQFDEDAATLEVGDTLAFGVNATGAPEMPKGQAGLTVGYVPL